MREFNWDARSIRVIRVSQTNFEFVTSLLGLPDLCFYRRTMVRHQPQFNDTTADFSLELWTSRDKIWGRRCKQWCRLLEFEISDNQWHEAEMSCSIQWYYGSFQPTLQMIPVTVKVSHMLYNFHLIWIDYNIMCVVHCTGCFIINVANCINIEHGNWHFRNKSKVANEY